MQVKSRRGERMVLWVRSADRKSFRAEVDDEAFPVVAEVHTNGKEWSWLVFPARVACLMPAQFVDTGLLHDSAVGALGAASEIINGAQGFDFLPSFEVQETPALEGKNCPTCGTRVA